FVVLVVGEQPRADAVPLEQTACVPRVLAEDDVGGGELGEDAQRHILEIADRRRADSERHQRTKVSSSRQCFASTCSYSTTVSARERSGRRGSTSAAVSSSSVFATVRCGTIRSWMPPYGGYSGNRSTIASVSAMNGSGDSGASQTSSENRSSRAKVTSKGPNG